jgi:hypothetical protein
VREIERLIKALRKLGQTIDFPSRVWIQMPGGTWYSRSVTDADWERRKKILEELLTRRTRSCCSKKRQLAVGGAQ